MLTTVKMPLRMAEQMLLHSTPLAAGRAGGDASRRSIAMAASICGNNIFCFISKISGERYLCLISTSRIAGRWRLLCIEMKYCLYGGENMQLLSNRYLPIISAISSKHAVMSQADAWQTISYVLRIWLSPRRRSRRIGIVDANGLRNIRRLLLHCRQGKIGSPAHELLVLAAALLEGTTGPVAAAGEPVSLKMRPVAHSQRGVDSSNTPHARA